MRDTNNVIEKTIIEYFIRVTKEHGYYITFRSGVINSGLMGLFIPNTNKRADNPLAISRNINELAMALEKFNDDFKGHLRDQGDKYNNITMNINHLLHFFLEPKGVKMEELCTIGEEIFNLTCTALYGDEFIKDQPKDSIEQMNDPMQVKSKIFQDYVDGMRRGELNCSFDEYWKNRKPEVDRWLNSHSGSGDRSRDQMFLQSADMPNRGLDDDGYYEDDGEPYEEDDDPYEEGGEPHEYGDENWNLPF